jgi:acetyltransferase-like isoleucine patch superfamily enzyme
MFRRLIVFLKSVLAIPVRIQPLHHRVYLLLRAIPKTIYFNFRYFKLRDAIRFPVWVSHRVTLLRTRGSVEIQGPVRFGLVRMGFAENTMTNPSFDRSTWDVWGKVIFKGWAVFALGTKIGVDNGNACLTFGSNMIFNANNEICCSKLISFGDYFQAGWGNLFMDTPYHNITVGEDVLNPPAPVHIGNHVWVTTRCSILQGTKLSDGSIVGLGSVVTAKYLKPNCLIGGYPGRVLMEGIGHEETMMDYFTAPESAAPAARS